MRKSLLFIVASFFVSSHSFAQTVDFKYNWGVAIEGTVNQSSKIIGIDNTADGNYLVGVTWGGTTPDGKTISWGGTNLTDADGNDIEGADNPKTSASGTANLLFTKVDATTGQPIWKVYTNGGDVLSSNCNFTPTSDGGAVLLIYGRQNPSANGELVQIVGNDGNVTYTQHTNSAKRTWRALLTKISSSGNVEWVRPINTLDISSQGKKITKTLYTYSLATDEDDNIYLSGRMCTTMYFLGENGRIVTVDGFYNDDLTDSNSSERGNAYLAMFTKDGYVTDVLTFPGEDYSYTQYDKVICADKKLYIFGVEKATGTDAKSHLAYTVIDLTTKQRTTHKEYEMEVNANGKQAFDTHDVSLIGDCFYLAGEFTGTLNDNGLSFVATTPAVSQRDGIVLRIDKDGKVLGGKTLGTTIVGIFGAIEVNDNIVVSCNMKGLEVITYDKELSSELSSATLFDCSTITGSNPATNGTDIAVMARPSKGDVKVYGETETVVNVAHNFGVVLGSWKMENSTNGIANIQTNAKKTTIYSIDGIEMNSEKPLPKGVYIKDGRKMVVK